MFSSVRGVTPQHPECSDRLNSSWSLQLAGNNTHTDFFPQQPPAACPHQLSDVTDLSAGSAALAAWLTGKGLRWRDGLPRGLGGKLRD